MGRTAQTDQPNQQSPAGATCLYCGDRIGVYEPIIVVEHDGERQTSLANEPELARRPRVLLVHSHCAPTDWDARPPGVTASLDRQGTAPPLP
jgi:hypothetical protein